MIRYGWMILTFALISMLIGCGGSSPSPQGQYGKLALTINWPSQTRAIPSLTDSITVEVTGCPAQTVGKPADGGASTVEFDKVPAGLVEVTVMANMLDNGQLKTLATASQVVTVAPNESTQLNISLESTIDQVKIQQGLNSVLVASAWDSSGTINIPVPADGFVWISMTPEFASVAPLATDSTHAIVTALLPGMATIRVVERDSGKFKEIQLAISAGQGHTGNLDVTLVNPTISISINPSTLTIRPTEVATETTLGHLRTHTFTATVSNSPNQTVNWSLQETTGGGSINAVTGYFIVPEVPGTYHVVATSVADPSVTATATVTVSLYADERPEYIYTRNIGMPGVGDGQFTSPWGVAVDSNDNLYVTDAEQNRVQRFSSDGTFALKWGSYGSGNGAFDNPRGIAVDRDDNIYVVEANAQRVQKFGSEGAFQQIFATIGFERLQTPQGIAINRFGEVYVVEEEAHRVVQFDHLGTTLNAFGSYSFNPANPFAQYNSGLQAPTGVAVNANGDVYVTNTQEHCVRKYTREGRIILSWGKLGSANGQFQHPRGIAVDAQGYVYVVDTDNNRVQKFSPNGSFLAVFGSAGTGNGKLRWPSGVTTDSKGNVYVADTGNHRVVVFSPASGDTWDAEIGVD